MYTINNLTSLVTREWTDERTHAAWTDL